MAKDPIFPLYYNDIDRSTKTWTDEEFGAYMRLLMEQWDKGFLPNDYQRLTRIATSLDKNWGMLKEKFPAIDGVLKNPVLEEHREKRAKHKEKQKNNIQKRYQKPTKNLPLEDEYEIENEKDIDLKLKESLDEIYIDQERMKWKQIDFDFELEAFKSKVIGSPDKYAGHDNGAIRLAFQAQLRNAKKLPVNGIKKGTLSAEEILAKLPK